MFRYYQPNITLLPYVESYWTANGIVEGEQTVRILPDLLGKNVSGQKWAVTTGS